MPCHRPDSTDSQVLSEEDFDTWMAAHATLADEQGASPSDRPSLLEDEDSDAASNELESTVGKSSDADSTSSMASTDHDPTCGKDRLALQSLVAGLRAEIYKRLDEAVELGRDEGGKATVAMLSDCCVRLACVAEKALDECDKEQAARESIESENAQLKQDVSQLDCRLDQLIRDSAATTAELMITKDQQSELLAANQAMSEALNNAKQTSEAAVTADILASEYAELVLSAGGHARRRRLAYKSQ
ncbi:hypothetical protein H4R19_002059 [Coemansia spiralis]|nr:hypothetical protein H4R19_002059 [Coemansia spiralis]